MIALRPRIDSERIKLQVLRRKEELKAVGEDSLIPFHAEFLNEKESLESLIKTHNQLDIVYEDVNKAERWLYEEINNNYQELIDFNKNEANPNLPRTIANLIDNLKLNKEEQRYLFTRVTNRYIGHGILEPLWQDKEITEIMLNGPRSIYVEIRGELYIVGPGSDVYPYIGFEDDRTYYAYVLNLFSQTGRGLDQIDCMRVGELYDGSRITVNWQPVTKHPIVAIRKPPETTKRYTSSSFVGTGAATTEMMNVLGLLTRGRCNIFILGETGSGKTTVERIEIEEHTRKERVIYLEDTRELNPDHPHFISMQTVERDTKPITFKELKRQTLRLRPDRISVQEIRSAEESVSLLETTLAGHDGIISTGHADSPRRFEKLLVIWLQQGGMHLSERSLIESIHEALDLLVFTQRMPDGSRKIVEMTEVLPIEGNDKGFRRLYYYDQRRKMHVQDCKLSQKTVDKCFKRGVEIPEQYIEETE